LKKQRKFLLAATLVIGMVGYLMVTGMRDSMEFYLTPAEVLSRVAVDPTIHDMGIRVGGRVAPGTVSYDARPLHRRRRLPGDRSSDEVRIPVRGGN
jgi:cytochrome c-type biogenesis protein CcmE